ncbi:MAG TPA: hypothetical protein VEK07_04145 [Polyangiaceae bacterium]|nr:hypothetical protein [Polyangiaceae bacterium]
MSTVEASPEARTGDPGRPALGARIAPRSPVSRAAWLLRSTAVVAVAASILGVIVAPGVVGNASELGVNLSQGAACVLAWFLLGLLLALFLSGTLELIKSGEVSVIARFGLIGGGGLVVVLSCLALRDRIPPWLAMIIAAVTALVSLAGAYSAASAPHTRAIAGVLCAFALGAITRLAAWELATRAGDAASMSLFGTSRGLATASVLFNAAAQLIAVTWLGTRGKWAGQLASIAALAGALVVTWSVAAGRHSGAAFWQAILHSSLADAPGVPPPYAFDNLATFLVPAALLLGLVAALQTGQVAAIVASMSLSLVSRGALDVPICALCAVVAAQWTTLASVDDRAMWRTLIDDRARRLREDEAMTAAMTPHNAQPRAVDGKRDASDPAGAS